MLLYLPLVRAPEVEQQDRIQVRTPARQKHRRRRDGHRGWCAGLRTLGGTNVSEQSEKRWWGAPHCERYTHTDPDDAIEEILDEASGPPADYGEVVVVEVAPVNVALYAYSVLDPLLNDLDEEYGDPEGEPTEPTKAMKQAAAAFVRAVVADYKVWLCEPTGNEVRVNALDWVRVHRPHWLEVQK
jgi:hypothetical protein